MQKYLLKNSSFTPPLRIITYRELADFVENCSNSDLKTSEWWRLEEVDGGRSHFTPPPPYAAFSIPDSEVEGA